MTTGQEFFDACCTFEGQPYSTAPGRTDPTSGHKDCSGLVAAGYQLTTTDELGAYVTVTIFDQAVQAGNVITYDEALATIGACILKPFDPYQGWGANGHIAVSDGQGGTVEATPPRVQRLSVAYNAPWSPRAVLLPGIDYGHGTPAQEDDDMVIVVGQTVFGVALACVVDGGPIGDAFTGPGDNQYGIPADALEWNSQPGRGLRYVFLDPVRLAAAITPRTAAPPVTGEGPTTEQRVAIDAAKQHIDAADEALATV